MCVCVQKISDVIYGVRERSVVHRVCVSLSLCERIGLNGSGKRRAELNETQRVLSKVRWKIYLTDYKMF